MVNTKFLALVFTVSFAVYSSAYPQYTDENEELPITTFSNENISSVDDVVLPSTISSNFPDENLLNKEINKPSGDIMNGGMDHRPNFNSTNSGTKGVMNGRMGHRPNFNSTNHGTKGVMNGRIGS
ncbi:hypothetical protein PIROE2DRAFT_6801 [Piromyces sp. E2]|nr:hypothetical protein PIROE2DRAFT_6801 [Piromyces sp. E2]|eukprot:OUM66089.1 hypothetical protein PIROE2DRAFT_6801 [Piromyces sp. E2]